MGARLTEEMQGKMSDAYWEVKEANKRAGITQCPRPKEVMREVKKQLTSKEELPSLRSFQSKVKDMIDKDKKLSKTPDAPWSMASSKDLPASALPAILAVWKFSLAHGYSFSNRTAKWVARLHTVIADTQKLYLRSFAYAVRERSYEIQGKDPYTGDLDASLVSGPWELLTMELIGRVQFERRQFLPNPFALDRKGYTGLDAVRMEEGFLRPELCDVAKRGTGPLPSIKRLKLCEDALFVYVHWLHHLSKGPTWRDLSEQQRIEVILELRDWIAQHPWAKGTPVPDTARIAQRLELKVPLKPTNLLKKVGYKEEK